MIINKDTFTFTDLENLEFEGCTVAEVLSMYFGYDLSTLYMNLLQDEITFTPEWAEDFNMSKSQLINDFAQHFNDDAKFKIVEKYGDNDWPVCRFTVNNKDFEIDWVVDEYAGDWN